MVKLKQIPEDFIVKEIKGIELSETPTSNHIYLLKKRNYTTERAVTQIAKSLNIPRKFIGYAGTKDKFAVTYQYISIKGVSKEKVQNLDLKDIELKFIGYVKENMRLGDLKGNVFEITLRDLSNDFHFYNGEKFLVPNYFDEQRFSLNNLDIGLALLKNQYKEALDIVLKSDEDFKDKIKTHLEKTPNDFVGALKILPKKTILFYVHSVQSYFFNQMLAEEIKNLGSHPYEIDYSEGKFVFSDSYPEIEELPLIGYLTKDYDDTLSSRDLTSKNFLIRSMPEFSLEGDFRKAFFKVNNFSFSKLEEDELNKGKKKIVVKFELGSGSYATIVIKNILAKNDLRIDN